jgi:ATP-dependent protease ClpP protease subunit
MSNIVKTLIMMLLFGSVMVRSQIDINQNTNTNTYTNNNTISINKIITLEPNNFIYIDGEINDDNVIKWSKDLSKIETNTMYIYIDSPGGSVEAGNTFIEQLIYYNKIGKSIECIVKKAYSMAFQILQNCDKRYILSGSTTMQHQMSVNNIKGPLINTLNYLKMVESMSNDLDKRSAKRIGVNFDEYKKLTQNDWWLYGEDIITKGVADEIVIVGCDNKLFNVEIESIISEVEISNDGLILLKDKKIKKYLCPV